MPKISVIQEAVHICRGAGITPYIWGHRGLGKSSLVRQMAHNNGWGFIDFRASQCEASDLRGLPDKVDGRTHFLPPADMPIGDMSWEQIKEKLGPLPEVKDGEFKSLQELRKYEIALKLLQPRNENGILFLDEVNRSADDVLQAIFQLVLDRQIGEYVLPPGWCVVAAGNFMEGYTVSGFNDPAFLNRFCHLTLSGGETTIEEWVNYMAEVHGADASEVIEFASQNTKHLDGDVKGELGFSIQPSRRSWEMVAKVQKVCNAKNYGTDARIAVLSGLIGADLAQGFLRYSCPVKPRDLLNRGVKAYERDLKGLKRGQLQGLMWGLVSFCKNIVDTDDKAAEVCLDFCEVLLDYTKEKDIAVAFCNALNSGKGKSDAEHAAAAMISNPNLAKMLSKYNKRHNKRQFLDRLVERPVLQAALANSIWGGEK